MDGIPCLVQVICTKVRDGDKRIVRLKEGEPRGRHVVIVDDLVQSGGTLRECQKLLSSQVHNVHVSLFFPGLTCVCLAIVGNNCHVSAIIVLSCLHHHTSQL